MLTLTFHYYRQYEYCFLHVCGSQQWETAIQKPTKRVKIPLPPKDWEGLADSISPSPLKEETAMSCPQSHQNHSQQKKKKKKPQPNSNGSDVNPRALGENKRVSQTRSASQTPVVKDSEDNSATARSLCTINHCARLLTQEALATAHQPQSTKPPCTRPRLEGLSSLQRPLPAPGVLKAHNAIPLVSVILCFFSKGRDSINKKF